MNRSTSSETNDQKLLRRKFSLRILFSIAVLGSLRLPVQAQTLAEWAYPVNPPLTPLDNTVQRHLAYSQAQIDDGFDPADWYPQDHPPMPDALLMAVRRPSHQERRSVRVQGRENAGGCPAA
jgi:hypothetical protein